MTTEEHAAGRNRGNENHGCGEPIDTDEHRCEFDWCDVTWRDQTEHWWCEYVTASLRSGDPYHLAIGQTAHRVGVGTSYSEGDQPAVVIHIDGGRGDDDVDAHLKLTEAVMLRDLLNRSIGHAAEALRHMCRQMSAAAVD